MKPILILLILIALAIAAYLIKHEKPPEFIVKPVPTKSVPKNTEAPIEKSNTETVKPHKLLPEINATKVSKPESKNPEIKKPEVKILNKDKQTDEDVAEDPDMFEAVGKVMKQIDADKQKSSED